MAATIKLICCSGENAGTETEVTEISFLNTDSCVSSDEERVNYPVTVPTSGYNRSYEKWIRFKCTVAPDNRCSNFKFYGSNTPPKDSSGNADITNRLSIWAKTTDTGATPSKPSDDSGFTECSTNYYDSDHALSVSGTLENVGDETDYVVLYLRVGPDTVQGNMESYTFYYEWSEQ